MKKLLLATLFAISSLFVNSQVIVATSSSVPVHLLGANSNCGSFVGPSISFMVPPSANGFPLTEIELTFEQNAGESGMSLGFVDCYLVDNLGGCHHFFKHSHQSIYEHARSYSSHIRICRPYLVFERTQYS